MTRYLPLVLVVAAAACADQATPPTSPLQPGNALYAGDPPPPTARGDGFADFSASEFSDFSAAQGALGASAAADVVPCVANSSFSFKWSYLINTQNNNAFLHINPDDESKHVTIHQTTVPNNRIDAHGQLVGPGFTFKILDALAGSIIAGSSEDPRIPGAVSVVLRGILTTSLGAKCEATGHLTAFLSGEIID